MSSPTSAMGKVYSPIIDPGQVDLLLAFEQLEAYRWLPYLKADGRMVVHQKLSPMPVITGSQKYPADFQKSCRRRARSHLDGCPVPYEGSENTKTANVVLLGRLAREMEISKEAWVTALREIVAPKFIQVNKKAFALGYQEN
ncbi:MAG: 2-oxoacid:acceptor oxidoreductase family protein [Bianqueaceae bacterium]